MCDVCEFVRQHASQYDDDQLDAVLRDVLDDPGAEIKDLYLHLAFACIGAAPAAEPAGMSADALERFVRLVQLVWNEYGEGETASEAYRRGYLDGQRDLRMAVVAPGSAALH